MSCITAPLYLTRVSSRCVRVFFRKIWKKLICLVENGRSDSSNGFFLCSPTMEVVTSNNKIEHFSVIMEFVLSFVLVPLITGQNIVDNVIPLCL